MKKAAIILLSLFATLSLDAKNDRVLVEKTYDFEDFNSLDISGIFNVTLEQADDYSVTMTVTEQHADQVRIKQEGDGLFLKTDAPVAKGLIENMVAEVIIRMPSFKSLSVNGTAKVRAAGDWELGRIDIDANGSSKITGLRIKADDANIAVGGMSRIQAVLECGVLDIKANGTGAADIEGKYQDVNIHAEVATDIVLTGESKTLAIKAVGTSGISAQKLQADYVKVNLGGAAGCRVYPRYTLDVVSAGASTCRYRADFDPKVTLIDVSRGSSVKVMN